MKHEPGFRQLLYPLEFSSENECPIVALVEREAPLNFLLFLPSCHHCPWRRFPANANIAVPLTLAVSNK